MKQEQQNPMPWPFPPSTGTVPWTKEQIAEYAAKQRDQLPDALM